MLEDVRVISNWAWLWFLLSFSLLLSWCTGLSTGICSVLLTLLGDRKTFWLLRLWRRHPGGAALPEQLLFQPPNQPNNRGRLADCLSCLPHVQVKQIDNHHCVLAGQGDIPEGWFLCVTVCSSGGSQLDQVETRLVQRLEQWPLTSCIQSLTDTSSDEVAHIL